MVRKKKLVVVAESVNPRGVIMPKNYLAYFLIIKRSPSENGETSNIDRVKNAVLKPILTICEVIAQW